MDNLALSQGGNFAFNSGGLAEGTGANTIQIATAINFTIDGRFFQKAITDNIAIAFAGASVYSPPNSLESVGGFVGGPNGSVRLYGVFLDSAGAVSIVPGPVADVAKLAAGEVALEFPPPQKSKATIGAIRVQVTSGTTFIPGTTDLGAAGVTDTYYNFSAMPAEPLRA
jgi:hypothetical protein